ncbi:methyltransferase domain-containing protein [Streptosporangiaceae bacterium NEAU-GS5]|nr:methyltransferase domain-containing protein [Streptosporangiaceae bacterium NEAU-GS5]
MGGVTGASPGIADYWDAAAPTFDDEPDHGLRAERVRAAWTRLIRGWAPPPPADVLDVGCGTGSLSLLLAEDGHRVSGVDLAPRMVRLAQDKLAAAGHTGRFVVGDAADPPTGRGRFDMVVCRHLVWTLPEPRSALREWLARLRPDGRLVLVEGRWAQAGQTGPHMAGTESLPWGNGVTADELVAALGPLVSDLRVESLSGDEDLWGRPVDDERYAVIAYR